MYKFFLIISTVFLFLGCSYEDRFYNSEIEYKKVQNEFKSAKETFIMAKISKEYSYVVEKEDLNNYFSKSFEEMLFANQLIALNNYMLWNPLNRRAINLNTVKINKHLSKARELMNYPLNRLSSIDYLMKNKERVLKEINETELEKELQKTSILFYDKYRKFPMQKTYFLKVEEDLKKIIDLYNEKKQGIYTVKNYYDFFVLYKELMEIKKEFMDFENEVLSSVDELYLDYSKSIIEIKRMNKVILKFNILKDGGKISVKKEILVDEDLSRIEQKVIAFRKGAIVSKYEEVPFDISFEIEGDTEVFVDEVKEVPVFKYLVISTDKYFITSFEEVSEDYYLANKKNLLKTIISKPLGFFEKESLIVPIDLGLMYVGNPLYGNWQKEHWVFNKQYEFLNKYKTFYKKDFKETKLLETHFLNDKLNSKQ